MAKKPVEKPAEEKSKVASVNDILNLDEPKPAVQIANVKTVEQEEPEAFSLADVAAPDAIDPDADDTVPASDSPAAELAQKLNDSGKYRVVQATKEGFNVWTPEGRLVNAGAGFDELSELVDALES